MITIMNTITKYSDFKGNIEKTVKIIGKLAKVITQSKKRKSLDKIIHVNKW